MVNERQHSFGCEAHNMSGNLVLRPGVGPPEDLTGANEHYLHALYAGLQQAGAEVLRPRSRSENLQQLSGRSVLS